MSDGHCDQNSPQAGTLHRNTHLWRPQEQCPTQSGTSAHSTCCGSGQAGRSLPGKHSTRNWQLCITNLSYSSSYLTQGMLFEIANLL